MLIPLTGAAAPDGIKARGPMRARLAMIFSKRRAIRRCTAVMAATVMAAALWPALVTGASAAAGTAQVAAARPRITLSPHAGPPSSTVTVSGTGFGADQVVDIYFDTQDEALASTGPGGAFHGIGIGVPASAVPGTHYVTAVRRSSGASAQAVFTVQASWPQFRNGPLHRADNTTENVLSPATVPGIDLDWSYTTGGPVNSSPAVASGTVYIGSGDGNVYALNAATGALDWSYTTGGPVDSSPAVASGTVYIGSGDGNVYALNAATGALDWSYTTGGPVDSSPAVASGTLYVVSQDGNLYALSAASGALDWSYATGGPGDSSPAVADGLVYIGTSEHVDALSAATGAAAWTYDLSFSASLSSAAVANGVVYIGDNEQNMYALKATTGAVAWDATSAGGRSSPAVANGLVYITAGQNVEALNAPTGAVDWAYNAGIFTSSSSPAVANGVVYIGSFDGTVYAFGQSGGTTDGVRRPDPAALRP
jgi:outer membrane protein assembly factor BamB